jgi:hypothetical protein
MYIRAMDYSCNNRRLFFRRLKINHESHEFILESGPVANINETCCYLLTETTFMYYFQKIFFFFTMEQKLQPALVKSMQPSI